MPYSSGSCVHSFSTEDHEVRYIVNGNSLVPLIKERQTGREVLLDGLDSGLKAQIQTEQQKARDLLRSARAQAITGVSGACTVEKNRHKVPVQHHEPFPQRTPDRGPHMSR